MTVARYREHTEEVLASHFAPPRRASRSEIEALGQSLAENPLVAAMLEAADVQVVVVGRERQILFANTTLLNALKLDASAVQGFRPGEAVQCVHAWDNPAGCGTSPHCAHCGVSQAILACQAEGQTVTRECRMSVGSRQTVEAREFQIKASPMQIDGQELTVVCFRDVSDQKRREALEQIFFHDILNTISGLYGYASLLRDGIVTEPNDVMQRIIALSERLRREVEDQRALLRAENGTLESEAEPALVDGVLRELQHIFGAQFALSGISLEVELRGDGMELTTDAGLLLRVLTNMVKNAFEASPRGQRVRVWSEANPSTCRFRVWNSGRMREEVARQVFTRSFTTKAQRGRGLGTYGMKLIGERYLHGQVSFETSDDGGTIFSVMLPRDWPTPTTATAESGG